MTIAVWTVTHLTMTRPNNQRKGPIVISDSGSFLSVDKGYINDDADFIVCNFPGYKIAGIQGQAGAIPADCHRYLTG